MTSVWAPLAARYASWLRLSDESTADISDEDPDEVRAMPLVLRLERRDPPARTPVLEAAAASAVALCMDERAQQDGPWYPRVHAWVSGRIRKVARRARGAHWQAVLDRPGVTVEVDGAQVRALVPERVVDLPKTVTRLQISGSDLPADAPPPPAPEFPVLYLNPGVPMTVGKAAAQVGHASMLLAMMLSADDADALAEWGEQGYRCQVRVASTARWTELTAGGDPARAWVECRVVLVRDAGFTEVAPGTVTVAAQWPPASWRWHPKRTDPARG